MGSKNLDLKISLSLAVHMWISSNYVKQLGREGKATRRKGKQDVE